MKRDKLIKNEHELPIILEKALRENDKTTIQQLQACIMAWWRKPENRATEFVKKIQSFGVSTDFARVASASWNVFMEMVAYDNFWEQAFRTVPLAPNTDNWEIHTVTNGITFRKVMEGHRLEVFGMAGTKSTVYVEKRGGAMGWTDEQLRFRKVAAMVEKSELMRNKYYVNKRDEHYALIAAAAPASGANSNTTAYQGAAADGRSNRILQTINSGAYSLGNRNKDKGYSGINNYILYLPESLRTDMEQARMLVERSAVTERSQKDGQFIPKLTYPVRFFYTWSSYIPANTGFLVHPGNKIQRAEPVAPFMLTDEDILQLTYVMAIWSYYGAAIGDTGQVQRLAFA
jgi:hypothetical protein